MVLEIFKKSPSVIQKLGGDSLIAAAVRRGIQVEMRLKMIVSELINEL